MIIKRLAILANSRKNSGRCVAGVSLDDHDYGQWIRPVSLRPGESLNESERFYVDNTDPKVLDIVDVPLVRAHPHSCQTENWLISTRKRWYKRGELSWRDAFDFIDKPKSIWMNGYSTRDGVNDEIPTEHAKNLKSSIGLIHAPSLEIHKIKNYTGDKTRIYASFFVNNVPYKLPVTDLEVENYFLKCDLGVYKVEECLMTISLGEPFIKNNGASCQYKLVAAIMTKP